MSEPDDDRQHGVAFGDLNADLTREEYPVSKTDLVAAHGDREIDLPDGSTTLREAIEGYEPVDGEFEDAEAVRAAVLNMVDSDAVGRENYSDRGGESEATDDPEESV